MVDKYEIGRTLGWHVLVPTFRDQTIKLHGFSKEATALWKEARKNDIITDSTCADLNVYYDNTRPFKSGKRWHVGNDVQQSQSLDTKVYALIPPSSPRIVLPLNNRKQLLRGLKLHQPGRKIARIAVFFITLAAKLGITFHLKRHILSIQSDWANDMPVAEPGSILYLGTSDNNRKTTILAPDDNRIVKYGIGKLPVESLCVEAQTLKSLSTTTLADRVPRLIQFNNDGVTAYVIQEYREPVKKNRLDYLQSVDFFLHDMSKINFEDRDGIPGYFSHGDFAPWNMINTRQGLFVFDWEHSLNWSPALTDAFYFKTAKYFNFGKARHAYFTKRSTLSFALRIGKRQGISSQCVNILWDNWLDSLYYGTTKKLVVALRNA